MSSMRNQYGLQIEHSESAERIRLAHGEGARATRRLIQDTICQRFASSRSGDAAVVQTASTDVALTTDSHVVTPLFFPGGDIGSLAVYGTVNDLAVAGAIPRFLTLSLIIEEGLPTVIFERVLDSIAAAAQQCQVQIIAGDTKVVPRGAADGLFINTTGVGDVGLTVPQGPQSIRSGDKIIVSGHIGRHGVAVLCAREDYGLTPPPESDSAPVTGAVQALLASSGEHVRCIRDATRGGLSAVLHEWADEGSVGFELDGTALPIDDRIRGVCELLGLDPLHVANEGTFVTVVEESAAEAAIAALRRNSLSQNAAIIGTAVQPDVCPVTVIRSLGVAQPLDEPTGAPLPRIC